MAQNKDIYRIATDDDIERLKQRWGRYMPVSNVSDESFKTLIAKYSEPHRAYHNVGHLVELFEYFDQHKNKLKDPETIALAIFYHDVIYDVARKDNEAKSATYAKKDIVKMLLPIKSAKRVANLVNLTASHDCDHEDYDAALFLDMDMAILGTNLQNYERYARAIAAEYQTIVPPKLYKAGRMQFLENCARKPHLFMTDLFSDLYDLQTRENLLAEQRNFKPMSSLKRALSNPQTSYKI